METCAAKKQNSGSAMEHALSNTNSVTIIVLQEEKLVVSSVFHLMEVSHIPQEIIKNVMENVLRCLNHAIIHVFLIITFAIFHIMKLHVMDAMNANM